MPYTLSVNPTTRIASIVIDDVSKLDEIFEAACRLIEDLRFGDNYGVLIDLREMRYTPFADDASRLANEIAGLGPLHGHPLGIVASRGAHLSLANMIAESTRLRHGVARAFHGNPDAAMKWLEEQLNVRRGNAL